MNDIWGGDYSLLPTYYLYIRTLTRGCKPIQFTKEAVRHNFTKQIAFHLGVLLMKLGNKLLQQAQLEPMQLHVE